MNTSTSTANCPRCGCPVGAAYGCAICDECREDIASDIPPPVQQNQRSITTTLNTHGVVLTFGKHAGKLLTRVPISYIRWMCNTDTPQSDLARVEFDRRGDTMPKVELTGHAIDNASLRVLRKWHETSRQDEGLYSWLQRMTLEAIESGERLDSGKIKYQGMKFVVEMGEEYPVLKTIMT
jgi:hypothetical protein